MSLYFLDTSALVKLYVQEPGTDRLLLLISRATEHRFAILTLSAVEARSAIRRRQRGGDIERSAADLVLWHLQKHLEVLFVRQIANDMVIDTAAEMVDRYALRAYDALQLAGCLIAGASDPEGVTFVASDHELLDAARSERLRVLDPAA